MSTVPTSERFSILKNGVDDRLEIIRDNESGFYNITKTAKMIKNLLESDENKENDPKSHNKEPVGFPTGSHKIKTTRHWFINSATQDLIDECLRQTKLDEVYYKLDKGIINDFKGTYVHELLYDHFLAWLDPKYAIKISVILKQIHKDANQKIIQEIVQEKNDNIAELKQMLQNQSIEMQKQSTEMQKLLAYAQDTSENLSEVKQELSEARLDIQENGIEIDRLNDKVDECRDVIIDRMEDHTLNPKSITKLQYFMCLQHPENDNELYAIRSQKPHIKKQLKAHHDWKVLIEPIEDPNSIKMFNRFKDRVKEIETSWKLEIKLRYKKGKINRESRDSKLEFIRENPLITINRNDIEFDIHRINLTQIIQLMQDMAFERFKLDVP